MNWEQVEGEWKQVKGAVKSKWAKLTDDDMQNVAGKKDNLVGKIQERYGIMKDEAEKQVDEWIAKFDQTLGQATNKAKNASDNARGDANVRGGVEGNANADIKRN